MTLFRARMMTVLLFGSFVPAVPQMATAQQHVATEVHDRASTVAIDHLLARPVTINIHRARLREALDRISASAQVLIQYGTDMIDAYARPVTLQVTAMPLRVALMRVLEGTSLRVVPDGTTRLLVVEGESPLVEGILAGTVSDANTKRPLRGVSVSIDGAPREVRTADDGTYRFTSITPGTHTVTVKFLGYVRRTQTVTVTDGDATTLNFALEPSANQLDQVVVTGTVAQTALKAVPNAMTVITAKDIEQRGITRIDQLFRGDVPGLFALNQGTSQFAPFDEVTMFSRGATALSNSSIGSNVTIAPLTNVIKTYIDGVELADPKYLSQIDPKSIERIEILTGPQASTIYGSNAINGVMQIFTKRGTSNTPQLTLNLLSGWVENNFSNAHTPQHDYSAQLNGIEGRLSYNAGSSWNYTGPWTPAQKSTQLGGFGGSRIDISTPAGQVHADMTLRRTTTQNVQRGNQRQARSGLTEMGWYIPGSFMPVSAPTIYSLHGQTLGLTLQYTQNSWWSHEFAIGQDVTDAQSMTTARGYTFVSAFGQDTALQLSQTHTDRRSLRYTTTARVSITSLALATVTFGADTWQDLTSSLSLSPQSLTGTLASDFYSVARQPGHNTGGFLQTQVGFADRLFVTYGLRAEWNPSFGADAQPNYAPRYGVAYTQDIGPVTVKLRGSYGRSTRPPVATFKTAVKAADVYNATTVQNWGNFDSRLANPDLAPEYQQGGEGGLELYVGQRGSLVVTRYNQTIDGLISAPTVDSARSLIPLPPGSAPSMDSAGYGYVYQTEYLNVGSIRNQGWELQGSANIGPFTSKGTYSWTKSRTIGITPKYRTFFTAKSYPQYQPGATFQYLPEHTWALGVTYAHQQTTVGINVTGIGALKNSQDFLSLHGLATSIRLPQNRLRMNTPTGYVNFSNGYALMDVTATRKLFTSVDGVLQIQNLTDRYKNDFAEDYAVLGRQTKLGIRVH